MKNQECANVFKFLSSADQNKEEPEDTETYKHNHKDIIKTKI